MDPMTCNHGNTVRYSTSLNIDRCALCGGLLVWCPLDHERAAGEWLGVQPGVRHWHYQEDTEGAVNLARAIEATLIGKERIERNK